MEVTVDRMDCTLDLMYQIRNSLIEFFYDEDNESVQPCRFYAKGYCRNWQWESMQVFTRR